MSLEEKIVNFLRNKNAISTLDIAKAVGKRTKKDINPTIYSLEKRKLIHRVTQSPPTWKFIGPQQNQNQNVLSNNSPIPPLPVTVNTNRKRPATFDSAINFKSINAALPKPLTAAAVANASGRNSVSVINEYAQSKRLRVEYDERASGPDHHKTFQAAVILGNDKYPWASDTTKKSAKIKAAGLALTKIKLPTEFQAGSSVTFPTAVPSQMLGSAIPFHDEIAQLVHHKYAQLSQNLADNISGRLILAGFVMSTCDAESDKPEYTVVSIGTGNRCIGGDKMSLKGETVNDNHAEVIARRGLVRFLYNVIQNADHKIILKSETQKFQIKPGVKFHLYISTAPCGDSAIFAPSDSNTDNSNAITNSFGHHPIFDNKKQGILRTKVENGEGCIPIDKDDNVPTWDGIVKGERLRTMSCSDKIAKWNFLGLQGSLLSKFLDPVYLSSLTLGHLYNHGHLTRAICCRISKVLPDDNLCSGYKVNHPTVGRVSFDNQNRQTGKVKTKEFSANWALGDAATEVLDGTVGKGENRFASSSISRLCKANLFARYKDLCTSFGMEDNNIGSTYVETKHKCVKYQNVKSVLYTAFSTAGYGTWMHKPLEEKDF